MKILMMEWKSFGHEDMIEGFQSLGHTVKTMPFSKEYLHSDEKTEEKIVEMIRRFSPDFVFSFNYFPIISLACKRADMRYVSWIYDSPFVLLYSYTTIYPGNFIFTFDQEQYLEFHKAGISTVHYLPLAANTDRLRKMCNDVLYQNSPWKNQTDISFVGSLYTEKHRFYQRLKNLSPYTKGYLEGIMTAQKKVYGCNFIQELLTKDIIDDLLKSLPMQPDPSSVESLEFLYAQYVINREITARERTELLKEIGTRFSYDLYTPDETITLPGAINHGAVDPYRISPYIFKHSKINLNFTLRSIKSGIPLRAFDILGSGGFLLTNYQPDFSGCYLPEEDFVFFDSPQDLLEKIDYYLCHEEERKAIAANGFLRTVQHHTYQHRIQEILSYLD